MKKLGVFVVLVAFLMSACGGVKSVVSYSVGLVSVESPANAKKQYGETKVVNLEDQGVNKYQYEDDFIKITWFVDSKRFNFNLENKSNHSIKINWDDISLVDVNGKACRVMHSGVKYNERNNSQPATTVPRGATLSDMLVPTENVIFVSSPLIMGSAGWGEATLLPTVFAKSEVQQAQAFVGKKMTILMPIIIENVPNEYTFTFNIDAVTTNANPNNTIKKQ